MISLVQHFMVAMIFLVYLLSRQEGERVPNLPMPDQRATTAAYLRSAPSCRHQGVVGALFTPLSNSSTCSLARARHRWAVAALACSTYDACMMSVVCNGAFFDLLILSHPR